jgi:hypothetical protein
MGFTLPRWRYNDGLTGSRSGEQGAPVTGRWRRIPGSATLVLALDHGRDVQAVGVRREDDLGNPGSQHQPEAVFSRRFLGYIHFCPIEAAAGPATGRCRGTTACPVAGAHRALSRLRPPPAQVS